MQEPVFVRSTDEGDVYSIDGNEYMTNKRLVETRAERRKREHDEKVYRRRDRRAKERQSARADHRQSGQSGEATDRVSGRLG